MRNFIIPFAEWILNFEDLDINHKDIHQYLKRLDFVDVEGNLKRPQITTSKNILDKIPLVKNYFETIVGDGLKEIGYNVNIKIGTSWGTCCRGKIVSEFHNHANYWISAVYYPAGSENTIQFKKPNLHTWEIATEKQNPSFTSFTSTDYTKTNKEGTLLVFPSYLEHRIINNNDERYSIAMNINPVGEIGTGDSKIVI